MLSDLLWCSIIACFLFVGLKRPYIALCGVAWVDILKPQNISYGILVGKPISFLLAGTFIFSCVLNSSDITIPKRKAPLVALVLFIVWITITTNYAMFQGPAWFKHDIAYKTILITLFFPFVLNSRVKVEAFLAVVVAAVSYYVIIGGGRTLLGQGQYGNALVATSSSNSGMAETSTLALVSVMMIPIIYYLLKHSLLVPKVSYFKPIFTCLILLCVLTSLGTYARTGLVALMVLASLVWCNAREKVRILFLGVFLVVLIFTFMPQSWRDRMNTIQTPDENASSLGRIVVWKWTIDFANEHPIFGGGFNAYLANKGELNRYTDTTISFDRAKAFHNIYFEVLGEHGYPGLFIFLFILFSTYRMNREIYKTVDTPYWLASLAKVLNVSFVIYCVCGNFIAIAFTGWPYYFLSLAVSLNNINDHKLLQERKGVKVEKAVVEKSVNSF